MLDEFLTSGMMCPDMKTLEVGGNRSLSMWISPSEKFYTSVANTDVDYAAFIEEQGDTEKHEKLLLQGDTEKL